MSWFSLHSLHIFPVGALLRNGKEREKEGGSERKADASKVEPTSFFLSLPPSSLDLPEN